MRRCFAIFVAMLLLLTLIPAPGVASEPMRLTIVLKSASITQADLTAIEQAGGTLLARIDEIGVLEVSAVDPVGFMAALLKHSSVHDVGPSLQMQADLVEAPSMQSTGLGPTDPADPSHYQWNIAQVTSNGAAWAVHEGTNSVVVGVIDTGIDLNHPDLAANIVPGSRTFVGGTPNDSNGHGTHVAGIIAANGQIRGVAPGVGLRAYRVAVGANVNLFAVYMAIVTAANDGVDVINLSLGGYTVAGQWWYVDPNTGKRTPDGNDAAAMVAFQRAVQYAIASNVTVVAAAGNQGLNLTNRRAVSDWYNQVVGPVYQVQGATFLVPGGLPGVITVAATAGGWGTADRFGYYSNYGSGVINLGAPGGDVGPGALDADYKYMILSTTPTALTKCVTPKALFGDCSYGFKLGTSAAAPHVSGVAALIISEQYARTGQKPSPAQVMTWLQQSATAMGKPGYSQFTGHGMVNAYQALNRR